MVSAALTPTRPSLLARLSHLPREARDTLLLLTVIALVLIPHVAYLPVWCSGVALGVLLWRAQVAWRNGALPGRWWLVALLVGVVTATVLEHRTLVGQHAGVTLLVLLLTLKTLELRARRDAYVVFFLSFFTILTAFFQSQSLGTAILVLLAFFGLMMALINANLMANPPSLKLLATLAAKLVLWGLPLMLVLFMLFPRLAPLWGMPNTNPQGKTGLSDNMEVGSMASLALDESIAFRILFKDEQVPAARNMYFRGPVLDRFDGRNWRAALDTLSYTSLDDLKLQFNGPSYDYEVTMEPNRWPWVFTLEATQQAPQLPPPYRTRLSAQLQWVTNQPISRVIRYQAKSTPDFSYTPNRDAKFKRHFLELPTGFDPRTRELAQTLKAQLPHASAEDFSAAVFNRLRSGGYTYTLEPGIYPRDTADFFWFDGKAGFCEHIASAFVVLMRAAGYPSRIVTGYQGAERNALDGYWVVQQANAHAWAEVWDDTKGWIRMDPTAAVMPSRVGAFERLQSSSGGAAVLNALNPTLLAQMRHVWEALDNAWTQRVLNYSQGEQLKLLEKLGIESPTWRDMLRVLALVASAGALGLLGLMLLKRKRQDPWIRLLTQAQTIWQPSSLPTQHPITPRRLGQFIEVSTEDPALKHAWLAWLNALERWRYAPSSAAAVSLSALRQQLKRLPTPVHRSGHSPACTSP